MSALRPSRHRAAQEHVSALAGDMLINLRTVRLHPQKHRSGIRFLWGTTQKKRETLPLLPPPVVEVITSTFPSRVWWLVVQGNPTRHEKDKKKLREKKSRFTINLYEKAKAKACQEKQKSNVLDT